MKNKGLGYLLKGAFFLTIGAGWYIATATSASFSAAAATVLILLGLIVTLSGLLGGGKSE